MEEIRLEKTCRTRFRYPGSKYEGEIFPDNDGDKDFLKYKLTDGRYCIAYRLLEEHFHQHHIEIYQMAAQRLTEYIAEEQRQNPCKHNPCKITVEEISDE